MIKRKRRRSNDKFNKLYLIIPAAVLAWYLMMGKMLTRTIPPTPPRPKQENPFLTPPPSPTLLGKQERGPPVMQKRAGFSRQLSFTPIIPELVHDPSPAHSPGHSPAHSVSSNPSFREVLTPSPRIVVSQPSPSGQSTRSGFSEISQEDWVSSLIRPRSTDKGDNVFGKKRRSRRKLKNKRS